MGEKQLFGAIPSTYADDPPVIDLHRDGQSDPHPAFARHVPLEFGPGAGKQMVRGHTRGGKTIPPHFRGKPAPDTSGNASNPMAPYTNPNERDTLPGGKAS